MSPAASQPRSAPRCTASSAAIIQSGQAWPGGTSFWPNLLTRPSMLVVVPRALMGLGGRQDHVGPFGEGSGRGCHGHDEPGCGQGPFDQPPVGKVVGRVRPQHDQGPDGGVGTGSIGAGSIGAGSIGTGSVGTGSTGAGSIGAGSIGTVGDVAGGRPQDGFGVAPPGGRNPSPTLGEPLPPGLEGHPAGQHPRSQPHVEGTVHVAPAQGGKEAGAVERGGQEVYGLPHQSAVLGQRRPAGHHHHVAVTGQLSGLGQGGGVDGAGHRRALVDQGGTRSVASPGTYRSDTAA